MKSEVSSANEGSFLDRYDVKQSNKLIPKATNREPALLIVVGPV